MEFIITPYPLPPEGSPQEYIAGFEVTAGNIDEATFNTIVPSLSTDWCTDVVLVPSTITNGYVKEGNIRARVKPNLGDKTRITYTTLTCEVTGDTSLVILPVKFTLSQKISETNPVFAAICDPTDLMVKDNYICSVSVKNRELKTFTTIFEGKPQPRPGNTYSNIRLNELVFNYIEEFMIDPDNFGFDEYINGTGVEAEVRLWTTGGSYDDPEKRSIYIFSPDRSYDTERKQLYRDYAKIYKDDQSSGMVNIEKTGMVNLNDPVNGHANSTQPFVFAFWNETSFPGNPNTEDKFICEESADGVTYTEKYSTYADVDRGRLIQYTISSGEINRSLEEGAMRYVAVRKSNSTTRVAYDRSYCGQYVLFYKNRFGGYDSFLIESNLIEKRTPNKTSWGDSVPYAYGNEDVLSGNVNSYKERIDSEKTTYSFNSGYLSDEQSDRFYNHLILTEEAYLYDCVEETYIPVKITNGEVEKEVFRNGRKLNSYRVDMEALIYKR